MRSPTAGTELTGTGLADTGLTGPAGYAAVPGGRRASRGKRGVLNRVGIILPASAIAAVAVAAVTIAAYLTSPRGSGADSLALAIDGLPKTGAVAALEQEEHQIAVMDAATTVMNVAAKPAVVSPAQVETQAEQSSQAAQSTEQQSSQETAQTQDTAPAAPADPTAAEATGEQLMLAAGFPSSQWSCLYDLWERESGWNVYAENPTSGAYGIPQALPGSKMASAGSDWQSDASTQIKWGLSYISSTYGTPCDAYNFDVSNGGY
ncbi:MAG: lytic transglycosylase domain-containing protein [Trebonia sp.]